MGLLTRLVVGVTGALACAAGAHAADWDLALDVRAIDSDGRTSFLDNGLGKFRFDDNPARINTLEQEFRKVTPELLQKTAQEYLRAGNRTVLEVQVQPKDAPKSGL